MSRVFLSHSSANSAEAIALRDWMISNGWDELFLDLDPERGLKAGERWQAALKRAAERCELVIFLVSPVWAASKWCLAEYLLAVSLNKRVVGVIVEPTPFEDLPTELTAEWQLVDLTAGRRDHEVEVTVPPGSQPAIVRFSSEGLNRLRIGLLQSGLDPSYFTWPPEHDPERAPYRGLRALEADDAGIFFGRAGPIILGIDMLRGLKETEPPRLAVILGASGAGKSSFMRAGLLPRLAREEQNFLPLPVIRPERAAVSGENGFAACLEGALKKAGIGRKWADIRAAIDAGASGVAPLLTQLVETKVSGVGRDGPNPVPSLILPIDQAEELFIAGGSNEASAFLSILHDLLIADAPPCMALFTIRSDHYEFLQTAKPLGDLRQCCHSLPPMPRGSFAEVIKGPATRLDGSPRQLTVEEPLIDALLTDVEAGGAKDALPLLAFTLERLYREHGGSGKLTLSDYQELGGIKGSIEAAVERALHLADADPRIPSDYKTRLDLLRRSLVPWLAGVDPDSGAPRRRIARRSELPPEALPLIELLVEQRLLAADVSQDIGEVTIEPAHEALLRQWGLLEGWLEEDFEDLATLEGVKRAARDWDANGRDDEWLTHASGRLEAAEQVSAREDFANILTATERAYLTAARATDDARRQAEFAMLKRDRRRSRIIAWGAACVALTMGALGWVMYGGWQDTLRTESLFLTDLSRQEVASGDPVTGLLLALEALSDSEADRLSQVLRPYVPAAQGALDAATSGGNWHDRLVIDHPDTVTAVAVSADGAYLVTGSIDHVARLWDAASGKLVAELDGHADRIFTVAVTPDGSRIVTGSDDGTARLWDASGQLITEFTGNARRVISVAVTADGRRVVTGSEDGLVRIWDAASGEILRELKGHRSGAYVAVTPDGSRVFTGSWDWTARLWNAETGAVLADFEGHTDSIRTVAMSADATRAVTGSRDKTARIWDIASGTLIAELVGHTDAVFGVAITPDGDRVITGSWDKTVRIWEGKTGNQIKVLRGHAGIVRDVAVAADGRRIVSGSWDKTARIWDIAGGKQIAELAGHGHMVSAVAMTRDGSHVITGSSNGTVGIWDAETGRSMQVASLEGDMSTVRSMAVAPDGSRVVTGLGDGTARICDAASGRAVARLVGHSAAVGAVAITPDGARVVTGSDDGAVGIWDAASGRRVGLLKVNNKAVYGVAVTPDGSRIVTASDDLTAWLWDAATGERLAALEGHADAIHSAAITPDGKRIVTGSKDKTVGLWDIGDKRVISSQLVGGTNPVLIVGMAPDGRRVVAGSNDGTARVWDTATGQQLAEFSGHAGPVTALAFSPDGGRIITGSADGTVRIWNAPPPAQDLIDRSKKSVSRCLTRAQRVQFHLPEEAPRWCYELGKWPYNDPETAQPANWHAQPFVAVAKWMKMQSENVLQLVTASATQSR